MCSLCVVCTDRQSVGGCSFCCRVPPPPPSLLHLQLLRQLLNFLALPGLLDFSPEEVGGGAEHRRPEATGRPVPADRGVAAGQEQHRTAAQHLSEDVGGQQTGGLARHPAEAGDLNEQRRQGHTEQQVYGAGLKGTIREKVVKMWD